MHDVAREDQPPDAPPEPAGVSRRAVLAAGLAVAAAAGAGVGLGALAPVPANAQPQPPAELTAALAAERRLLATIDASIRQDPSLRTALGSIRRNHAAHAAALQAAVADYPAPPSRSAATTPPQPLDRSGLRAAERVAAGRAATRASILGGRNAAMLASIAACEASHAELL